MKKLKILFIITIFTLIVILSLASEIYATDEEIVNLTMEKFMNYTYKSPSLVKPDNISGVIDFFQIEEPNQAGISPYYCAKAAIEFKVKVIAGETKEYQKTANFKTQANTVSYYYNDVFSDPLGNEEYNSLLWIIDNMYIPGEPSKESAEEYKEQLLNNVFKWAIEKDVSFIEEDIKNTEEKDIKIAQQAAIWYFTDYDKDLINADVISISEDEDNSEEKLRQINAIYKYFVTNAKANAEKYGTGNVRELTLTKTEINVNSANKTTNIDDNFTTIGPFDIKKTEGSLDYIQEILIKDEKGNDISSYIGDSLYIVKNVENTSSDFETLEKTINEGKFYIKFPNALHEITDIEIKATVTHDKAYKTSAFLYTEVNGSSQPIIKATRTEILDGEFNIYLNKVDANGSLLKGADFRVTHNSSPITITTSGNGIFKLPTVVINEEGQTFIYDIEEFTAPTNYIGLKENFRIKITTNINEDKTAYIVTDVSFIDEDGNIVEVEGVSYELNNNTVTVTIENKKIKEFDLSLRKYISNVEGKTPTIDTSKLNTVNEETGKIIETAFYAHKKEATEVKTGDKITYNISVYNEGEVNGLVTAIIDYLPEGLEFDIANNTEFIERKNEYTDDELVGKKYAYTFDNTTRELRILPIKGEYLGEYLFEVTAFNGENLDSKSIEIVCTVTATTDNADKVLTNIATMEYKPSDTSEMAKDAFDRDSSFGNLTLPKTTEELKNYRGSEDNQPYLGDKTYYYKGKEDDDDFDKVVIKGVPFDLALRKFITKVNGIEVEGREPEIDLNKLNTINTVTGNKITTAKYTHTKEPVIVKQGDIVTFTIRVYNEGDLNGYAMEIADYLPEGLGYILDYKANTDNYWTAEQSNETEVINLVGEIGLYKSEDLITNLKSEDFYTAKSLKDVKILTGNAKIYTDLLEDTVIKAYNPELKETDIDVSEVKWQQSTSGTDGLYYQDVEVTCIVLVENTFEGTLRNIAEVQKYKAIDSNDKIIDVTDRDSTENNIEKDNYNPPADNSSYQEDDDDYELVELKYFDLALRKFITAVEEQEITTRIPEVKLNAEGKLEYNHDKTPVYVANSDIVTYTIRVYNEGTVAGYAMEVSDDIPNGVVFLPEHELNKQYGWKMYDVNGKETDDYTKAVEIKTTYLNNTLLNSYDATKAISATEPLNPDYADVKAAFQVIEENITQEDRIVINKAQITDDKAVDENGNEINLEDEDSVPAKWNEGEDDQDIEKIYVQKFDLALLKWVTKTIVTVDGKTTTTETGFTPYDNPEPIAKAVIDKKKINKTSVKFVYNIIIMNQGEIPGYATEITDYIPEGLEFVAEDNPIWTKEGKNKITTRALENKLLQPGETATVEVVFRWINNENNFGLKTNIAEISEDYNDKGSKDIDSDPDNVETRDYDKQQEDDDDKALVILETKTGGGITYIWICLLVLLIIAGGILLIQKFVM